jgi:mono/diheme cytochrome c family protein
MQIRFRILVKEFMMKKSSFLMIGLASLMLPNISMAQTAAKVSEVYADRCANCHGVKAEGVPKLKEKPGVSVSVADGQGMASEEKANIFGPPLNGLSKEVLAAKLLDLRNKGYDSHSYHSVMVQNLKTIEKREGKISDESMAEYISNTFGGSSN